MSDSVIQVEKLSKRFTIGEREAYTQLREAIMSRLAAPFRGRANENGNTATSGRRHAEALWALRDISFDVKQCEVVGLIGRNGAGKSTLLKILARITRPTSGWARVRGRIGSLLEVGTGFHGELTGRENVFLSGAVLGMKKAEIRKKFDEIVAFSEVERFLDTPLKRYSSGMQMRLAFAVAAHLEPEILLVDEVLAVGDIAFQKKCLGKMSDVAQHGRTIVFVSHNMAQIRRLCQRAVWLDAASVRMDGSVQEVAASYEAVMARGAQNGRQSRAVISQTRFTAWEIDNRTTRNPYTLDHLNRVTIRVDLEVQQPLRKAQHGIALYNHEQRLIWARPLEQIELESGDHSIYHTFPMLPLRPGLYTWLVTLYDWEQRLLDSWYCEPEMIVAADSHQAPSDQWTGLLNLPSGMELKAASGAAPAIAVSEDES